MVPVNWHSTFAVSQPHSTRTKHWPPYPQRFPAKRGTIAIPLGKHRFCPRETAANKWHTFPRQPLRWRWVWWGYEKIQNPIVNSIIGVKERREEKKRRKGKEKTKKKSKKKARMTRTSLSVRVPSIGLIGRRRKAVPNTATCACSLVPERRARLTGHPDVDWWRKRPMRSVPNWYSYTWETEDKWQRH